MTDTLGVAMVGDVEEVRETATEAAEEGVETPGVDDADEEGSWTAMGSCSSLRSANRQQQKDSNLAVLNRVAKRTGNLLALLAFILNFPMRIADTNLRAAVLITANLASAVLTSFNQAKLH